MTAQEWLVLANACRALLIEVERHEGEISAAMKNSGSNYRLGSFRAPVHALMHIAKDMHDAAHRQEKAKGRGK